MNSYNYFAVFYVEEPYYLPHFLPVSDEMKQRDLPHAWLFPDKTIKNSGAIAEGLGLRLLKGVPENPEAGADFFIFGNGYDRLASVPGVTVLIYHGIGTKSCYYERDLNRFNIRFVEGEYRKKELDSRSPAAGQKRPVVGFSKLDPAVRFSPADREEFLVSLGLDPSRKTVIYAPTYYPSSIELMDRRFPEDCGNLNLIVKPHQFSYSARYRGQIRMMEKWEKSSNVHLAGPEEYNILPFFSVSDVMISDESSAIFEFAALGKPVIRNRFVNLRLSYRLFPWKLRKRMDGDIERYSGIARNACDYQETIQMLREIITVPPVDNPRMKQYYRELIGDVDGKASERIVDYLLSHSRH
ncbi:MAG: CDP-glycerol glycerophosphotransferase family protein [Deltaproteobacteria bacterium]|nr:CDP-glycerol glycerophosphotransferase family protein [Deltaproteobacteria bacterium]